MVWESLSTRIANLPLVICGPILRHTESDSVTIWIAVKEHRTLSLRVYTVVGPATSDESLLVLLKEFKKLLVTNFLIL